MSGIHKGLPGQPRIPFTLVARLRGEMRDIAREEIARLDLTPGGGEPATPDLFIALDDDDVPYYVTNGTGTHALLLDDDGVPYFTPWED